MVAHCLVSFVWCIRLLDAFGSVRDKNDAHWSMSPIRPIFSPLTPIWVHSWNKSSGLFLLSCFFAFWARPVRKHRKKIRAITKCGSMENITSQLPSRLTHQTITKGVALTPFFTPLFNCWSRPIIMEFGYLRVCTWVSLAIKLSMCVNRLHKCHGRENR